LIASDGCSRFCYLVTDNNEEGGFARAVIETARKFNSFELPAVRIYGSIVYVNTYRSNIAVPASSGGQ
jgi:hypothetical protein